MLSLVEYDNSDSEEEANSGGDDEISDDTTSSMGAVQIVTKPEKETNSLTNGFESLPEPHFNSVNSVEEDDDEFLKKKEIPTEKPKKQPIKIVVPSLSQFDSDDEETPAKKPKVNDKSCGLFSLLPPPKTAPTSTKHFIPNVVKKNINKRVQPPKKPTVSAPKRKEIKTTESLDSEDEEDLKDLPDTFDDETWQKVCGRKEKQVPKSIKGECLENKNVILPNPEVQKPYNGLDNQAFKELIGGGSKRKGETIDIVEINEDEILYDKKIWMTKSLTDPEMAPKYVVENPVNDTCRRKHHITYLAQQAKANEQELQNQWAQSRFTRQKTQAKYGF